METNEGIRTEQIKMLNIFIESMDQLPHNEDTYVPWMKLYNSLYEYKNALEHERND